jgi:hypothetical protein
MKHSDFQIGTEFYSATGKWRCTDLGSRVIVAIKLEGDQRDWIGPPYSVTEIVFDEYDLEGLSLSLIK